MRSRLPGRPDASSAPGSGDDATATARTPSFAAVPTAAVTASPAPSPDRGPRLQKGVRALAIASAQLLLIVAGLVVVGWVLGRLWPVLLPAILGLLFATVLWPPTRLLRRLHFPPALAALVVLLLFFAVVVGLFSWIVPQVAAQTGELADAATAGLQDVQQWVTGPPLNLGEDQIGQAVDQVINSVQGNAQNIAGYALTGVGAVGSGLLNLVLALVLAFFFIKDGPRWLPWLAAQTGPKVAPHVAALSYKTWTTLSEFIRQQALVGFIDAFFIGLGLWILDVPLVLPLAVLTFFGAFIPIIGAFVAGAFAVLIALVSNGWQTALIVLVIVLVVQQLEGNVLQPILQGRGLNLHAAVVILAVTAGGSLYGILGTFLGVPVAALIAVFYRYVRDELDGRTPEVADDGTRVQVTGDETGATVVRERVAAPAPGSVADDVPDGDDDTPARPPA
ncbi:AI-2E family transporter [Geodermatophilus poikilotrophus]|uniref:Predicted PurR-regulated permease PerM n=1 Tax=Geodermatophilus poikilotrophus TaxID=1333667 RepID=A0A1H9ZWZ3_9ACTN|nr:AI-2E family transporter [Geodermatophilus poikilotrophus]SES85411.1 Predicted PurR-regulated permease PerM [Geodermatophilus poikilotrophus]